MLKTYFTNRNIDFTVATFNLGVVTVGSHGNRRRDGKKSDLLLDLKGELIKRYFRDREKISHLETIGGRLGLAWRRRKWRRTGVRR